MRFFSIILITLLLCTTFSFAAECSTSYNIKQIQDSDNLPKIGESLEVTLDKYDLNFLSNGNQKLALSNINIIEKTDTYAIEFEDYIAKYTVLFEGFDFGDQMHIFEKEYKIIDFDGTTLSLTESNNKRDTLMEGETRSFVLGSKEYDLKLLIVSDTSNDAKFVSGGQVSDKITEGSSFMFSNGLYITNIDIMPNEGTEEEGGDIVEFTIYSIDKKYNNGDDGITITDSSMHYTFTGDLSVVEGEKGSYNSPFNQDIEVYFPIYEDGAYIFVGEGSVYCESTKPVCGDGLCGEEESCSEDSCCDGLEVNLFTDNNNCGSCDNNCDDNEYCNKGLCIKEEYCGDGICQNNEDCSSCVKDCGCKSSKKCNSGVCETFCGNGICEANEKEKCSEDCDWCGDGECQSNENCESCLKDCGCLGTERCDSGVCNTFCGNGICESNEEEICKDDCEWCGDGVCQEGESCQTCRTDCECLIENKDAKVTVKGDEVKIENQNILESKKLNENDLEITSEKEGKVLGLFSVSVKTKAKLDLENSEYEVIDKPWWSIFVW